jgi:hypothetical protein
MPRRHVFALLVAKAPDLVRSSAAGGFPWFSLRNKHGIVENCSSWAENSLGQQGPAI